MAIIKNDILIDATTSRVWEIISDIDSEPKFWKGTKSVKNLENDGDVRVREITLAFRDKVCGQRVTLCAPTSVTAEFTHGIIKGSKVASISKEGDSVRLNIVWDIAMTGILSMFTSTITRHVKSGTVMALETIKKEAESR